MMETTAEAISSLRHLLKRWLSVSINQCLVSPLTAKCTGNTMSVCCIMLPKWFCQSLIYISNINICLFANKICFLVIDFDNKKLISS